MNSASFSALIAKYRNMIPALGLSVAMAAATTAVMSGIAPSLAQDTNDELRKENLEIASSLAAMLRAGRTVISRSQKAINNPDLGDKGLDGKTVLSEALKIYQTTTGIDPSTIDRSTRHGKLLQAQMDAIVAVMDANQPMLNRKGIAFKGFIPAVFGRLVNVEFGKRAAGDAEMKVTAPVDLVRNRKAVPDRWEAEVIQAQLQKPQWPKGQPFADDADNKGRNAFRVAVPEYYAASCLSCHGGPKGDIDVTGYPKEGGQEGELGGVISITLYKPAS